MATDTELAWAAGFIDGEGCIHIARAMHRQYLNYQLVLRVTQRIPEPLERLDEIFPGLGFTGSFRASRYTRKEQLHWGASNAAAATVLRQVFPYLVGKREQAELALEFADLRTQKRAKDPKTGRFLTFDKSRYQEMYEQMRALKVVMPYGHSV